ncbi:PDZ domain-containing protein [Jeotgalibacillus sp. R-1-5s-1]|uniref:PDZ domain-containing protein n=1 Tax=Jeotgalibacillus sp. R-1-5s-1 TaxID=2555897 RepID=UPI00141B9B40|nr:PDZ domain-containing protein [Jeotgalibacillus sp. R-1-5s-1]
MIDQWFSELLTAGLSILLNPVLYIGAVAAGLAGVWRIKRERKDLRTSVKPWYIELAGFFGLSLILGLLFSVGLSGAGIPLNLYWIYAVSALTLLIMLTGQFRLLSSAFLFPIVAGGAVAIMFFNVTLPEWFPEPATELLLPAAVIMSLLLIGEGLLIRFNAGENTSPRFITTPRGMKAGAFFTKRMWLVPLLIPVPDGAITALGWWPLIDTGGSYSLLILPAVIGFQLTVVHDLPDSILKRISAQVIWLGLLCGVIAAGSIYAPVLIYVSFAAAFIGRLVLVLRTRALCRYSGYHFIDKERGVMIIEVLPGSPAAKMGLLRGEIIHKVNGQLVKNETEIYAALQKNLAHCKLEILNYDGEVRYAQTALHEGQHYQLGLILIENRSRYQAS